MSPPKPAGLATNIRRVEAKPTDEAIRAQLGRILSSSLFANSKRYPALLSFVVEKKLQGELDHLKERSLGIEVFSRPADYDTNLDPVVRVTAGEIRKRLAQYYQETRDPIRIELPSGSYVPEFRTESAVLPAPPEKPTPAKRAARWWWAAPLCAGLLAAGTVLTLSVSRRGSAMDEFWRPVIRSQDPVLLCVGRAVQGSLDTRVPADAWPEKYFIAFSDATTLARIAGTLQAAGKKFSMQPEAATNFSQLRSGPVVLIGAFNNEWTMRLTEKLRYTFEIDAANQMCRVRDRVNPSSKTWSVSLKRPDGGVTEDYAIISRVRDATTDRAVIVAAGILGYGTAAAGEFLTAPEYLEAMARSAPKGWQGRNLQVVIGTQVIDGNSGPPRLLAVYSW
jgi:hypothetical protein